MIPDRQQSNLSVVLSYERECSSPSIPAPFSYSIAYRTLYGTFNAGTVSVTSEAGDRFCFPVYFDRSGAHCALKTYIVAPEWARDMSWHSVFAYIRRMTDVPVVTMDVAWPFRGSPGPEFRRIPIATYWILCEGKSLEQLISECDERTRSKIRKAGTYPFSLSWSTGAISDDFYELYCGRMRAFGTTPKLPEYFDRLTSAFGEKLESICIRNAGGILLGCSIIVRSLGTTTLLFSVSSIDARIYHVDHLLYRELMRRALLAGSRRIDLGGSSSDVGRSFQFKTGFGAVGVPLFRAVNGTSWARLRIWLKRKMHATLIRINLTWNFLHQLRKSSKT